MHGRNAAAEPRLSEQAMTGQRLLHYDVLDKLGEGGMGVVYKARDVRLNRFVVLKVLRSDTAGDQDRNRRFFQEAQAASALNHPNIITIYDMAAESGVAFIVMEFIPGKALDALIKPSGMPVDQVLNIAIQIADALSVAHSAGVIHRDLKPGNIMMTPSGLVKLLDFGLAKLTAVWHAGNSGSADQHVATVEGSIVGTVAYMSPEQALGRPLDARSDLFGFGAVLYEMLTGRRVFGNASPVVALTSVLRDVPVHPSVANPKVPHALGDLVMRCLEKAPERRFESAAQLRAEVGRIAGSLNQRASVGAAVFSEAREALRGWTSASLARAKECFEHALRNDGDRCGVYAGISEYYATASLLGVRNPEDAMLKAEWAARKALEIDPGCEQARVTLGLATACHHFQWEKAKSWFSSVESAESMTRYAFWYLRPQGQFGEAESMLQGNELALAWLALERGALDVATEHASRCGQQHWIAAWVFAWALLDRGLATNAIEMCERAVELEPDQPYLESALATAYARNGQADEARRMLDRKKWMPPWYAIPVHAALGNGDEAFAAALEAVKRHDPGVITALRLPGTAVVRVGPRFAELVREMNLHRPLSNMAIG